MKNIMTKLGLTFLSLSQRKAKKKSSSKFHQGISLIGESTKENFSLVGSKIVKVGEYSPNDAGRAIKRKIKSITTKTVAVKEKSKHTRTTRAKKVSAAMKKIQVLEAQNQELMAYINAPLLKRITMDKPKRLSMAKAK